MKNDHCSVSQAAKAARVSRHTILKSMSSGKLAYTVDDHGQKMIPIGALQALFKLDDGVFGGSAAQADTAHGAGGAGDGETIAALQNEIRRLQSRLALQEKTLAELKRDKAFLEKRLESVDKSG